MREKISDVEFIKLFESLGARKLSEQIDISESNIYKRRRRIESESGDSVVPPSRSYLLEKHPSKIDIPVYSGVVVVGSDAHYWPGVVTAAHRAFVKLIKELQPKVVVMNGDVLDGASISRHPPIGHENVPTLISELEASQDRLAEIQDASGSRCRRTWPLGNHDSRYETKLAHSAPEYTNIHGMSLRDHFPAWEPCWLTMLNEDVVIKHRHKNGIHSTHNSTMWAGTTMVCGHLHSMKVTPFSDYNGTRFGVDTGTLAEPYGDQFKNYTELNPVNWRSGFVVLTFHKGKLLWPEVCHVIGKDQVEFRGKIIKV